MTVNYEFFDQITRTARSTLVKQLQNGERPQPTRGTRLCTLKEMAVQLAGFADDRGDALADGPAGEPTLAATGSPSGSASRCRLRPETPIGQKDEPQRRSRPSHAEGGLGRKPAGDARAASAVRRRKLTQLQVLEADAGADQALAVARRVEARRLRAARRLHARCARRSGAPGRADPAGQGLRACAAAAAPASRPA